MRIVEPSVCLMGNCSYEDMIRDVEYAGRISTKTEDRSTGEQFIKNRIQEEHYSVLRHAHITVHMVCSRRVSHEFVRHHVGVDIVQESTRWCNYAKDRFGQELSFYLPPALEAHPTAVGLLCSIEQIYKQLVAEGFGPDDAGYVLPNALKTEMVVTANVEAWRTIITKRTHKKVLPEFRSLMQQLYYLFMNNYPIFFEDLKINA